MVLTLLDTTRKVSGVEQDTGALGHGLAFAVGLALAGKRGRKDYRVFTLLGHGELAEGSHWEARMTHHSLHDFAALRAINNVTVVASADNFETREAVVAAAKTDAPVYLRFGKKKMPHLPRGAEGFELGKASVVRQGTDLRFLACGETLAPAWEAAESLTKEGIACRVVGVHTIKPLDIHGSALAETAHGLLARH